MYVNVILDIPYPAGKRFYTYMLPPCLENMVLPGCRVMVPFGSRSRQKIALVISVQPNCTLDMPLKEIDELIDAEPIISEELLYLGQWVAKRTVSTYWSVFSAMLPNYVKLNTTYSLNKTDPSNLSILQKISDQARTIFEQLEDETLLSDLFLSNSDNLKLIKELEKKGLVSINLRIKHRGNIKKETFYTAVPTNTDELESPEIKGLLQRAYKQKEILLHLIVDGPQSFDSLNRMFPSAKIFLDKLEAKGLIRKNEQIITRTPQINEVFLDNRTFELTLEQKNALNKIYAALQTAMHHSFLLFGITGSGKTEIYIRSAQQTLKKGRQVLLLVPEISLTSQLVGRFESIFQDQVAVMHSNLSDGERYDQWREIKNGRKNIVIGVRSAVFVPLDNIGLIIVDEAHDGSYKQSEPEPRYHARLVAEKRAKENNAVFIAGTATPAIELFYRAQNSSMTLLELSHRANKSPLPEVFIIDMREELRLGNRDIFSIRLLNALKNTIMNGEQAILYLNRRGYSTFVMCRECGEVINCDQCDISMTYYRQHNILRCNYCNKIIPVPTHCPTCGSESIRYFGSGTELVCQAFQNHFPDVPFVRLDSDAIRKKNDHQAILSAFKQGNAQVMIGTQMAGKGFDFPNVTLVGVISADIPLHMPDYRASERTFQQLTQVAGRAGRGTKPGKVFIQTYMPNHPAIIAASHQNFKMFYFHEIAVRSQLNYPPYVHILRVVASDEDKIKATTFMTGLAAVLQSSAQYAIELLGPSAAPIERIRNRFRVQLIVKCRSLKQLLKLGETSRLQATTSRNSKSLRVTVDIDPENIL